MVKKEQCRAVFLDRDGVICRAFIRNGKSFAPRSLKDFILMPNSKCSVEILKQSGFKVIVVTNQPDIGNGLVTSEEVEAMHSKLISKTGVDDVFLCAHRQNEGCECRKPKPGMLLTASKKHGINLNQSFMVGDRASDIAAGLNAGCRSVFIDRNYQEPGPEHVEARVNSLQSAVVYIQSTL